MIAQWSEQYIFKYTVNTYMYKTIQARVNTVEIPTTGKSSSLYWELPNLPINGNLPIEAKGILDIG